MYGDCAPYVHSLEKWVKTMMMLSQTLDGGKMVEPLQEVGHEMSVWVAGLCEGKWFHSNSTDARPTNTDSI